MHQEEVLFYDGHCGLCHRAVQFILKDDRSGASFRFAPLQGETFLARVPVDRHGGLPDSIVVQTREGALLVRSDACVHVLRRLGRGWRVLAVLLAAIPRPLRDAAYNLVSTSRYRVFGRRENSCPVVSLELRARFYR